MEHIQEVCDAAGGGIGEYDEIFSPKIENIQTKKIVCRYGRGCTHMQDSLHQERFWHPPILKLTLEQLKVYHVCNECGMTFDILSDLQKHLIKKTAWSNLSLVNSKISCLVDNKEWHEGTVLQYHSKSNKHLVQFRSEKDKKWLYMTKIAFYIIERPISMNEGSNEVKEMDGGDPEHVAAAAPYDDEEHWVYFEDISVDYAYAQSILFKVYGGMIQETGHKTKGHICVTVDDRENARSLKGSLLYGELLPRGANKALGVSHLNAGNAQILFDLGCGTGKIAIQSFLQFRNLIYVYGIELSYGRYCLGEEAVLRMVEFLGRENFLVEIVAGSSIMVTELHYENDSTLRRILKLEYGNMMDIRDIQTADIIMLETDIPQDLHSELCQLLFGMHEGARTLTYLDLKKIWDPSFCMFPMRQLEVNRSLTDRFPTSWSVQRGHHFYIWLKTSRPPMLSSAPKLSLKPNSRNSSNNGTANNLNDPNSPIDGGSYNKYSSPSYHFLEMKMDRSCLPFLFRSNGPRKKTNSTTVAVADNLPVITTSSHHNSSHDKARKLPPSPVMSSSSKSKSNNNINNGTSGKSSVLQNNNNNGCNNNSYNGSSNNGTNSNGKNESSQTSKSKVCSNDNGGYDNRGIPDGALIVTDCESAANNSERAGDLSGNSNNNNSDSTTTAISTIVREIKTPDRQPRLPIASVGSWCDEGNGHGRSSFTSAGGGGGGGGGTSGRNSSTSRQSRSPRTPPPINQLTSSSRSGTPSLNNTTTTTTAAAAFIASAGSSQGVYESSNLTTFPKNQHNASTVSNTSNHGGRNSMSRSSPRSILVSPKSPPPPVTPPYDEHQLSRDNEPIKYATTTTTVNKGAAGRDRLVATATATEEAEAAAAHYSPGDVSYRKKSINNNNSNNCNGAKKNTIQQSPPGTVPVPVPDTDTSTSHNKQNVHKKSGSARGAASNYNSSSGCAIC